MEILIKGIRFPDTDEFIKEDGSIMTSMDKMMSLMTLDTDLFGTVIVDYYLISGYSTDENIQLKGRTVIQINDDVSIGDIKKTIKNKIIEEGITFDEIAGDNQ